MANKDASGTMDMPDSAFDGMVRIARMTLHDAALNQIRDMIIEGKLAPGMRINEGQVGAMLGVSRTPLREAIKSLVGEGLVEILPAKGAVVRRFSIEDIRDILEVIKALEQSAARLACERASDAEIATIAALHEEMLALYRSRNRLAYFKLNQAIHSALVRASGNPVLSETHEQLQARIKRIRFIGNETPDRWAGAVEDHEAMIEALRRRDAPALVEAVGVHLDRTLDRVRDTVV
ncbi:MAG: GntR family transcriptional regulator [Beijerinckiaceae bacterium]|jgi:DNA-binding GntR family transcriptional regulator|nr:GntR family transcriptional regulator [Beijerinckiaceae bacterium]